MSNVVHVKNFYSHGAAAQIAGRRRCCRCSGYALPDSVFVLQSLHNVWSLRPATDLDRKVLWIDCGQAAHAARMGDPR
jgi:hypothetical protein